jgi:cobalt/nickel transport system permease protein
MRFELGGKMHIPDGFLDTKTWVTATAASAGTIAYAVRRVNKDLEEKDIPLMGVLAAFIFAAQMINFPVAGGTSGHFLGAALSTILLGPWKAILAMFSVVTVQALLFGDGGITALGANVLNMAIVGTLMSYIVHSRLKNINVATAAFGAGFISVFLASLACALELGVSGTTPLSVALPMMSGWHFLIGIGEGIITAVTIGYLLKVRPDLVKNNMPLGKQGALVMVSVAAFVSLVLSPYASAFPDGLERVAEDAGFLENGKTLFAALIPDYAFPGVSNESLATAIAGIIGVAITLVVAYAIGVALKRRSREA